MFQPMPAPTPVQKASRTRPKPKYSAARAFYLTILVITAIAVLSLSKERRLQHNVAGANDALSSRAHVTVRNALLQGSSGELERRDKAVRWVSFGATTLEDMHQAHDAFHSADSSMLPKTNAPSFAPTAQMRKQVSSPTYNCTIASCIRLNLSPSLS